jgi:hypothetical protein
MNHRKYYNWGSVSAWKGTTASDIMAADRVELEAGFGLDKETLKFNMLDGNALEATKRALDYAFAAGVRAAKKEIRESLDIKEPRS